MSDIKIKHGYETRFLTAYGIIFTGIDGDGTFHYKDSERLREVRAQYASDRESIDEECRIEDEERHAKPSKTDENETDEDYEYEPDETPAKRPPEPVEQPSFSSLHSFGKETEQTQREQGQLFPDRSPLVKFADSLGWTLHQDEDFPHHLYRHVMRESKRIGERGDAVKHAEAFGPLFGKAFRAFLNYFPPEERILHEHFEAIFRAAWASHEFPDLIQRRIESSHDEKVGILIPNSYARDLGLLYGQSGVGKSLYSCKITSWISTGGELPFEDGHAVLGSVLYLDGERNSELIEEQIREFGGDRSRVIVDSHSVDYLDLSKRFSSFETLVSERKPDLVILDPIYAFDGLDKNERAHNETVQKIMKNLRHLTRKLRCGVILVCSAREGGSKPLGAQAFYLAPNVAEFLAFEDPENENGRRVLIQKKNVHAEKRRPRLWETKANGLPWIDQGTFVHLSRRQKLERILWVLLHGQKRTKSYLRKCIEDQGIIVSKQTWGRAMKSMRVQKVGEPVMRGTVEVDSWLTIPRGTPPPEGLAVFGRL